MEVTMKRLIALVFLIPFLFQSCVALTAFTTAAQNPVLQSAVQYGVIKFLSGDNKKITKAEEIVDKLMKFSEQSADITISQMEKIVMTSISWEKLDKADQFILIELLEKISHEVRDRIGDGLLNEDDKIKVRDFLYWIKKAIEFSKI